MSAVQFIRNWRAYNAGESAVLSHEAADRLIKAGIAEKSEVKKSVSKSKKTKSDDKPDEE